jgi:hypothetical protein
MRLQRFDDGASISAAGTRVTDRAEAVLALPFKTGCALFRCNFVIEIILSWFSASRDRGGRMSRAILMKGAERSWRLTVTSTGVFNADRILG